MAIINVRFVGKSPAGGRLARVRRGSKLVVKPTKCPFLRKVWDRHRQSSGGRTSAGRSTGLESPHWWKDQLIAGLGLVVRAPRRTGHCVSPLAAPPPLPLPSDSVITEFRGSNHGPAAALRGYAGILLAEREGDKQRILSAFTLLSINDAFIRIWITIDKKRNRYRYTIKSL